ncbi:hypothetical protein [Capnocytophaga sp. oral taxon 903]|jgi:hypothetical protein|uniref:hypothetical protein n=1 Tax=Capnocytophaga sp. oral taxon 903 TaxID=2748317 RepID=UPI0015BBDABA|nr:hypothetical protein [Capnocytophaga sp. oral taxon 903]NWO29475.1 hypothetical protein [Capnocytophaga sp. oral taxon 903]
MKKFLFLAIMLMTLTYCKKNVDCQTPPPEFSLLINKNSEVYKEFINQTEEIDKSHITFYKQVNSTKKPYDVRLYYTANNDYLVVTTQLWFTNDVYTGKTETLYLQNASKTYKIEVNGYMKSGECGEYAVTNEIRVDGTKIEVPYLAK